MVFIVPWGFKFQCISLNCDSFLILKENDGSVHGYIICTVEAPRMRGYWREKDEIGYVLTEFGSSLFNVWVGEEVGGGQPSGQGWDSGL